jgi:hypothetical protein
MTKIIPKLGQGPTKFIAKKDFMNFHRYFDARKNILTSMKLVGNSPVMTNSIFTGYNLSSSPVITYPKYTNDY